jgi:hypothetical protein
LQICHFLAEPLAKLEKYKKTPGHLHKKCEQFATKCKHNAKQAKKTVKLEKTMVLLFFGHFPNFFYIFLGF